MINIVLAPQTGYNSYFGNTPALIENKGWEIELSSVNIQKRSSAGKPISTLLFHQIPCLNILVLKIAVMRGDTSLASPHVSSVDFSLPEWIRKPGSPNSGMWMAMGRSVISMTM
ncbi:hypothetical protein KUH03_01500 [Sphingobacterium sp. E70]|uniref:hypothetical protein n=1 Tax=Sphingobacterium sp. E70 TaxID=2853439 RepID=UPI00211C49FA|nr:hypothetical protein [Sphingobacterium sp. E70]ULT25706.1 hypothetical protein KUH03_01500 [Sphingobacterium sp. E70]